MNYGKKSTAKKRTALISRSSMMGKRARVSFIRVLFVSLIALCIAVTCLGVGSFRGVIDTAPDVDDIDIMPLGYATFLYDDAGNQIRKLAAPDSNRLPVTLDQIPVDLQHAVVAIEDERFYEHNGIDVKGILRAGMKALTTGDFSEGASTITQQLLKNNVFTNWTSESTQLERFTRKIQEQYLAIQVEKKTEKFEVSARTVSRWETGINMPDLSILVQLAEYYDVEIRELLDGERSQTMNKEMKETLDKVAVYEEWVKQKALKAGNLAFASMFVISVLAIIIQMLLTVDIRLVLGETATALVGGILYASIMVYNGIWDKCLPKSATIWRDFFTSVICAGIFTVIYGICLFRMGATETQVTRLAVGFLIGITIVAFIVLRLLAFINRKRNQNSSNVQEKKETSISKAEWTKIYNAQNIVETEQLVEMLKQNGIAAFSQEAGANVAMHGAPGFGIYGVDIFVKTDDAEKAVQLIKEINNQE